MKALYTHGLYHRRGIYDTRCEYDHQSPILDSDSPKAAIVEEQIILIIINNIWAPSKSYLNPSVCIEQLDWPKSECLYLGKLGITRCKQLPYL